MPVNKYKLDKSLRKYKGDEHVIVQGPLTKRDLTTLHKYRDEQVLTLRRIQADSFEFIADWADLRSLRVYACKVGDWSQLVKHKWLEHVFINTVRDRAPDFSFLSQLGRLQDLGIGYVPHLTSLPDLSRCKRLKRLSLFNCKRLDDLSPVLRIASLESFHLVETPQQPSDLEPIMAMPKMKFMSGAFGNQEKDTLFRELMRKHGLEYGG